MKKTKKATKPTTVSASMTMKLVGLQA